jgi:hypothetical protein
VCLQDLLLFFLIVIYESLYYNFRDLKYVIFKNIFPFFNVLN